MPDPVFNSQAPTEVTRAQSTNPARSSAGTSLSTASCPGRFYRSDEQGPFRELSPNCAPEGLFPPGETLLERQSTALSYLAHLDEWISIMEVTRLCKRQMGAAVWNHSLLHTTLPQLLPDVGASLQTAMHRIDRLFCAVATAVHQLLSWCHQEVLHATSKEQIDRIFARMETEVLRRRNGRRLRARRIFQRMRQRIGSRLFVHDDVLDHMRRTMFALDSNYDYDEHSVSDFHQMFRNYWHHVRLSQESEASRATLAWQARGMGYSPAQSTINVAPESNMGPTDPQMWNFDGDNILLSLEQTIQAIDQERTALAVQNARRDFENRYGPNLGPQEEQELRQYIAHMYDVVLEA